MSSYTAIYEVVSCIPYGRVATYGQIAELAGLAGKARLVGYALYQVDPQQDAIPWHRVVNAKGMVSLSPLRRGTDYWQQALLEQEGIVFDSEGKLNLRQYRWQP